MYCIVLYCTQKATFCNYAKLLSAVNVRQTFVAFDLTLCCSYSMIQRWKRTEMKDLQCCRNSLHC